MIKHLHSGDKADMKHHRFAATTPAGNTVVIKGDPNMDPKTLAALTEMMDLASEQAEREMATIVKHCPRCGQPLTERTNRESGEPFLGCSAYPTCKHTEELPESVRLRRAGQPTLFDEEAPGD